MIVVDTSIFVDYLFEKDKERNEIAADFINSLEGLSVFVPRIFLIELMSVAKRLGLKIAREEIIDLSEDFSLLSEDTIFDEALKISEKVHPRAVDAYFIATSRLTSSILITNDKIMADNAKKYGVEVYYLIEDLYKAMERINELSQL